MEKPLDPRGEMPAGARRPSDRAATPPNAAPKRGNTPGGRRANTPAAAAEEVAKVEEPLPPPPPPPETAAELHARLLSEARSPLETAGLAKMRVWEVGDKGYTLAELMELVRWAETRLPDPAQEQGFLPILLKPDPRRRALLVVAALFALLLLGLLTVAASKACRLAEASAAGQLLGFPSGSTAGIGASTGNAVELRSILRYPTLPDELLRRAEDVVLTNDGEFQLYRVASVARTTNGGVRLAGHDGTTIRVEDGKVALRQPQQPEVVADMRGHEPDASGADAWAHLGVFRSLAVWQSG